MGFFITDALAATDAVAPQAANGTVSMMMMVGLIVVFYFLLWRPQSKRAKEHRELVGGLQKGDEIVSSGGILGRIKRVEEKFIEMTIAEGVDIKIQRSAVSTVLPKGTVKSI